MGGFWSAYWYNGHIYGSEIARGLDVFELTPTEFLTQNEIDAAKSVKVAEFNVQNQEKIEWPNSLVIAKAYLDQLERSKALSAGEIGSMRKMIQSVGTSKENKKDLLGKLKSLAPSLKKIAGTSKSGTDSARLTALAQILSKPAL